MKRACGGLRLSLENMRVSCLIEWSSEIIAAGPRRIKLRKTRLEATAFMPKTYQE